ncbi:MAG: hypothetical protein M3530_06180 [Thermoproteota archaeon]|nr:hypothetical protein [Thermoproteota archaeon]
MKKRRQAYLNLNIEQQNAVGSFYEMVEDTSIQITSIRSLLHVNQYDLNQTVTIETGFVFGAVFSQIINGSPRGDIRTLKSSRYGLHTLLLLKAVIWY